jgi:hypothetical protein
MDNNIKRIANYDHYAIIDQYRYYIYLTAPNNHLKVGDYMEFETLNNNLILATILEINNKGITIYANY